MTRRSATLSTAAIVRDLFRALRDVRALDEATRLRVAALLESEASDLRAEPDQLRVWAMLYDSDDPALHGHASRKGL